MAKARRESRGNRSNETLMARAAGTAGRVLGQAVAAVSSRAGLAAANDPIDILKQDHRRLEALLKKGEATTERGVKVRTALLAQLTAELTVHERAEEKVLYPALKPHDKARDVVLEGYQEHHVADVLIRELQRLPPGDERWGAKFKVLKENIEHHIEEEEGEMFPTARSVLGADELAAVADDIEAIKADRPPRRR